MNVSPTTCIIFVKSFLPDAEISQKVDPEQELLIEMTAEEEPNLEEQAW